MNTYQNYSDRQLTDLLNDRDNAAYAELYNRHWKIIYKYALRFRLGEESAKDIVQDTFMRLYAQIGQTDFSTVNIAPYLYTISRNLILTLFAREEVRERHAASLVRYFNNEYQHADAGILESEIVRQIEEEISRLPKKTRLVFEKSRKHYLSNKAIAEELDMNEPTVRKHLANAMQRIKARLGMRFFLLVMQAILWLYR